ncbi:MAG TPA: FAD:protein FMN transferase [Candidatus Azoamicus sp. OHIO2]
MNTFAARRKFLKKMLFWGCVASMAVFMESNIYDKPIYFLSESFTTMGTHGRIQAFDLNTPYNAACTVQNAIKRINELEKVLSKFKPFSDISNLNTNPLVYHDVSPDTIYVMEKSNNYTKATNGYFNVGMGNFLSLAGIDTIVPLIGSNFFKHGITNKLIKIKNNKIKLLNDNAMLDLGGIGKGYAIDEAMTILINGGIKHAAIELGGDIKVYGGMPDSSYWNIIINTNLKNDVIKLHSGSIALSSGYLKAATTNTHNIKHHIINPKTLTSKNYYSSVLVVGEKSITCDALSTAYFNMTQTEIDKIRLKFPDYEIKTYI